VYNIAQAVAATSNVNTAKTVFCPRVICSSPGAIVVRSRNLLWHISRKWQGAFRGLLCSGRTVSRRASLRLLENLRSSWLQFILKAYRQQDRRATTPTQKYYRGFNRRSPALQFSNELAAETSRPILVITNH
jgi:hypothetical protein